MLLKEYVDRYVSGRDVSSDYVRQLLWSVDRIERFIGHSAEMESLSDELVNRWIASMIESGLARRTVRSQRNNIVALWKAAADERLVPLPGKIRPVKCPRPVPDASRPERLAAILDKADLLTGTFRRSRVDRRLFWLAFVRVEWESGLRLGDMLRLERSHIAEGLLSLAQSKTGWPIIRPLSPECLAAIDATFPPVRKRIFGDAISRGAVQKGMRRLLAAIGLKGGTKRLRRSGATAVERLQPGAAMAYLGHKTPGLAYQYYVDPRLCGGNGVMPPPLAPPAGGENA